jgi:hypothetical protein
MGPLAKRTSHPSCRVYGRYSDRFFINIKADFTKLAATIALSIISPIVYLPKLKSRIHSKNNFFSSKKYLTRDTLKHSKTKVEQPINKNEHRNLNNKK